MFKEKGLNVTEVDKADFEKNVVEKVDLRGLRLREGRLGSHPRDQVNRSDGAGR